MTVKWRYVAVTAVAVLVVVLFLLKGFEEPVTPVTPEPEPEPMPEPTQREFLIRVSGAGYSPDKIEVNQGDVVVLSLRAVDGKDYSLVLNEYKVALYTAPGRDATTVFLADAKGTFRFRNTIASGPGAGEIEGWMIVNQRK